jgi:hypothetical protein
VDVSVDYINGSLEEGLPERDARVHDLKGVYKVVTLRGKEEICTLNDREMAEAVLLDLRRNRITEEEAKRIAESGFSSFLYSLKVNLRNLLRSISAVVSQ